MWPRLLLRLKKILVGEELTESNVGELSLGRSPDFSTDVWTLRCSATGGATIDWDVTLAESLKGPLFDI